MRDKGTDYKVAYKVAYRSLLDGPSIVMFWICNVNLGYFMDYWNDITLYSDFIIPHYATYIGIDPAVVRYENFLWRRYSCEARRANYVRRCSLTVCSMRCQTSLNCAIVTLKPSINSAGWWQVNMTPICPPSLPPWPTANSGHVCTVGGLSVSQSGPHPLRISDTMMSRHRWRQVSAAT